MMCSALLLLIPHRGGSISISIPEIDFRDRIMPSYLEKNILREN